MASPLSGTRWDPEHYLRFADRRTRPGIELLARIPDVEPSRIVDLGAGTGHLTAMLAARWPTARVTGIDASTDMLERARTEHPELDWQHADIADWAPDGPVDVLFSNAALHWLDDHASLFPRLRRCLAPGGVLAVQVPDNWREPSHQVPAAVLDDGSWPDEVRALLMRDRVAPPADYLRWLQPATVDLWRTTYWQELTGPDPVWAWTSGSLLRPVIEALESGDLPRFRDAVVAGYRAAYPPGDDGVTLLPFSRVFLVARVPG